MTQAKQKVLNWIKRSQRVDPFKQLTSSEPASLPLLRHYRTAQSLPTPVLNEFYDRLSEADLADIERYLTPDTIALRNQVCSESDDPELAKRYVTLHLGVYHEVPAVLEKTGLSPINPPDDVHSMGRGPLAAGGTTYYADLVTGAVEKAGISLPEAASVLDFGSSSGRVLRVLKAAYPNWNCAGCDPNEGAIAWANQNLKNCEFEVSSLRPPLPYANETFDLAYAISIWSHFNEVPALLWFEEMRRIIKPQGYLLFTTHGFQSIHLYKKQNAWSDDLLKPILPALYDKGFYFINLFGENGDWGVVDADWGHAFLSPEWWLDHLCPQWQVCLFMPGAVEQNQDLILLKRVI